MRVNLTLKLSLLIFFSARLSAQDMNAGARITSLGNTGVVIQDVWSLQSNQAGVAILKEPVIAFSYQNNYLNSDIRTQSAVFAFPFKNNVLGLSFQNYGISVYSEQKIGFAYAKRFGNNVSAALTINAHQVKISQYGATRTYSVEAGVQFKPSSKFLIGSHLANPGRNGYDKQADVRVPTLLEVGVSYQVSDKVRFNSGLLKDLDWLTDARFGLEYDVMECLSLRGGLNVNPFRQFAGFGCKYQKLSVDVAAASHPHLGYSTQISLGYEF